MIGIVLLDQYNRYLIGNDLPQRPNRDKELLSLLVSHFEVSDAAKAILPPSISSLAGTKPPQLGIKIREIGKSDVIIVHRTKDFRPIGFDRVFRLDGYSKLEGVELWIKDL